MQCLPIFKEKCKDLIPLILLLFFQPWLRFSNRYSKFNKEEETIVGCRITILNATKSFHWKLTYPFIQIAHIRTYLIQEETDARKYF